MSGRQRFHGRIEGAGDCAVPDCGEAGEFRAPAGGMRNDFEGPGDWVFLCLDHVRAFNSGYNYFNGMSAEEIEAAQTPFGGWDRQTRAFASLGGSPTPKWADFHDPLDAIGARFKARMAEAAGRGDGKPLAPADRDALQVLGLGPDADRKALRGRYSELVRRYHPDRNGGDRSHEAALQRVVDAYQRLRRAPAFGIPAK